MLSTSSEVVDIPCRCGHARRVHPYIGELSFKVCNGCFMKNRPAGVRQHNSVDCESYVQDNLSLVEKLAKERGLI